MRRDLFNVKVGDPVCLVEAFGWTRKMHYAARGVVEKVTKTQVTALSGRRFLIRNGAEVGREDRWSRAPRLKMDTPELQAEIAASDAMVKAEKLCRAVAAILEKAREEDALRLAAMIGDALKSESTP